MRLHILSISLALTAYASAPVAPNSPNRDPRVDSIMNAAIRPMEPGGSVIVIRNGRIIHQAGYGLADLEKKVPNTPETLYHLASTGKQFTGMAIMMMKQQGLLQYSDPVSRHLPRLSRFSGVILLNMLHHVSGLPDYYEDTTGYNRLLALDSTPDNADIVTLYESWGTPVPCCTGFLYNNAAYDLLGSLIEHKAGQSLDAYLRQRIFDPLGMTSTFSMPNPARFADPRRARGYDKEGEGWTVNDYDPFDELVGSGSIYSSVRDLYLYDQALYTDRLVPQATLADAFTPITLTGGEVSHYGFGWDLGTTEGHEYTGHGGSWEGYLSYILRFPRTKFSVYVLLNRTDVRPKELAGKIFEVFEPGL